MPKFIIYASITQDLKTTIEADTLEEATKIAESEELLTEDFECENQEFKVSLVVPE